MPTRSPRQFFCLFLLACASGCARTQKPSAPPDAHDGAIARENRRPGTTAWQLSRVEPVAANVRDDLYVRQRAIEGYVSHTSIRAGETLDVFVSTNPPAPFGLEIYRMGHYGGTGARLVTSVGPVAGVTQPDPVDGDKNLIEANWKPSVHLPIGRDWPSGVYLGKLTETLNGYQSYVIFVVRDDRRADLMVQVSDLTWQAYNRWPAWRSLYDWKDSRWHTRPGARVGFDRPYSFYYNTLPSTLTIATNGSGEFLLWEFPLVFWLEREGYDVTYVSNLDTHQNRAGLLRAKGLLSVGHDEYWTRQMMDNVTWARDQGLHLAFLGGNSLDGEITLLPATDGRPDRTFQRFEGRGDEDDFGDEQALMGASSYGVGLGDWIVTRADHWLFAGTGLKDGDRIPGLVGWEFHGPPLGVHDSLVVVAGGTVFDDADPTAVKGEFAATVYEGPRGNVIFNAGTCWWNMPLASPPGFVNPPGKDFSREDPRVQHITRNLLARMIGTGSGGAISPGPGAK